jgi:hypothetical protein
MKSRTVIFIILGALAVLLGTLEFLGSADSVKQSNEKSDQVDSSSILKQEAVLQGSGAAGPRVPVEGASDKVELTFHALLGDHEIIGKPEWEFVQPLELAAELWKSGRETTVSVKRGIEVGIVCHCIGKNGKVLRGSKNVVSTADGEHYVQLRPISAAVFGVVSKVDKPLFDVRVNLYDGHSVFQRRTDSEGSFSFVGLQPGSYKIQIGDSLAPFKDEAFELGLGEQRQIDVEVPGQDVTVFVHQVDGAPVPSGLDIALHHLGENGSFEKRRYGKLARTDGSDRVVFEGVPPGEVYIEFGFSKLSAFKAAKKGLSPTSTYSRVVDEDIAVTLMIPNLTGFTVLVFSATSPNPLNLSIWMETVEGEQLTPLGNEYLSGSRRADVIPAHPGRVVIWAGGWQHGYGSAEVFLNSGETHEVRIDIENPGTRIPFRISPEVIEEYEFLYLLDGSGRLASLRRASREKLTLNFGQGPDGVATLGKSTEGNDSEDDWLELDFLIPKYGDYRLYGQSDSGWHPLGRYSIQDRRQQEVSLEQ